MATKKKNRSTKAKAVAKSDAAKADNQSYLTPSGIRTFLQEVKAEFSKIVWPQKKVTFGMTGFVIVLVIVISLYLGAVDLLLGKLVSTILN